MIKTFKQAARLVDELKVLTIFSSDKTELPSLWEHVDLPEKQDGESGWGKKIEAVWTWKNRLPAAYPDEIFYGKIKGGFAVLMAMDYLRETHFPMAYQPVAELDPLAKFIYEKIRIEPWETTVLRKEVMAGYGCSKSRFDTALKKLQISLNIVRCNDPDIERDTWITFREAYPDIWDRYLQEKS